MTAQVGDSFKFKNREYSIVAINSPLEFRPQQYGITPLACCTACWDGYWCEYVISEEGIVLDTFYVNSKDDYYPEINGVMPLSEEGKLKKSFLYMGHHCYKGVNIKVPYTGRILVGKDFMREYYIHMGYQRAWAYKDLKEFVFERGALTDVIDHSDMAEKLREQIEKAPEFVNKLRSDMPLFIENCFDLSFDAKAWWLRE